MTWLNSPEVQFVNVLRPAAAVRDRVVTAAKGLDVDVVPLLPLQPVVPGAPHQDVRSIRPQELAVAL